jgi:hypothetical protein
VRLFSLSLSSNLSPPPSFSRKWYHGLMRMVHGVRAGGTSVLIQHYLLELGRLEAQCDPASTTAHWVPDDTVDSCRHCSSAFSKLTRRVCVLSHPPHSLT